VRQQASSEHSRSRDQPAGGARQPPPAGLRQAASPQARALALQRLAGNRATVKSLARWAAHPDPEKKGVIVPDVVAAEFVRFNPPKNT
jgi:hypothetical protein